MTFRWLVLALMLVAVPVSARDAWQQPFSSTSPWNMPIGDRAVFVPAGFRPATWMTIDEELLFVTNANDPLRRLYAPADWVKRCGGTSFQGTEIPLPDDLVIPDAEPGRTPNNCGAFLMPDGRTVVQANPLARCAPGGPIFGWAAPNNDLYGDGIPGGHGGSGLSSLGGSIRRGELTGPNPIRHVLKVNIFGQKYLWKFPEGGEGFRWPAWRQDGCSPDCYGGTNPAVVMGSLLALRSAVADTMSLETIPGRKIRDALRDYGAYVVDDTAWDVYALCVEQGVRQEFRETYSLAIETQGGPWFRDMMKIFAALSVVNNNSPTSIGGGGTPRRPLLPPLPLP